MIYSYRHMKKKLKAKFIGPKVIGGRYDDLTIGKIYDGYLNEWDEFIIFSDDVDEENYLNRNKFVIVEDQLDSVVRKYKFNFE